MAKYMDSFPFPYYVMLKNIEALPRTLADLLRQVWSNTYFWLMSFLIVNKWMLNSSLLFSAVQWFELMQSANE